MPRKGSFRGETKGSGQRRNPKWIFPVSRCLCGELRVRQDLTMKIEAITLREIQMPLVHFFETSFGRTYSRRILSSPCTAKASMDGARASSEKILFTAASGSKLRGPR